MHSVSAVNRQNRITYSKQCVITMLLCLSTIMQYIYLIVDSYVASSSSLIIDLFKMSSCVLYIIIALIVLPYVKNDKIILLVVGCLYLLIRTVIIYKVFNLLLINVPMLIALILFPEIKLKRKFVKNITLCSVICFLLLFVTSYYDGSGYLVSRIFNGLKINRNLIGMVIAVNTYLLLASYSNYKSKRIIPFYLGVYFVALLMCIILQSRTTLLCVCLVIFFHVCIIKRNFKSKKLYHFLVLTILLSAFSSILVVYLIAPYINGLLGYSIFSSREFIYNDALSVALKRENFLFGFGFDRFTEFGNYDGIWPTHNQWLQYFLNYGLFYLVYIIFAYIIVFRKVLTYAGGSKTIKFFVLMQIILFIYSITETIFFMYFTSFTFFNVYVTCFEEVDAEKNKQKVVINSLKLTRVGDKS